MVGKIAVKKSSLLRHLWTNAEISAGMRKKYLWTLKLLDWGLFRRPLSERKGIGVMPMERHVI